MGASHKKTGKATTTRGDRGVVAPRGKGGHMTATAANRQKCPRGVQGKEIGHGEGGAEKN